jgi:hypothetical protein
MRINSFSVIDWNRRSTRDAIVIFAVALLAYASADRIALFDSMIALHASYGAWGLDNLVIICATLSASLAIYAWRRVQDAGVEMAARLAAEAEVRRAGLSHRPATDRALQRGGRSSRGTARIGTRRLISPVSLRFSMVPPRFQA